MKHGSGKKLHVMKVSLFASYHNSAA